LDTKNLYKQHLLASQPFGAEQGFCKDFWVGAEAWLALKAYVFTALAVLESMVNECNLRRELIQSTTSIRFFVRISEICFCQEDFFAEIKFDCFYFFPEQQQVNLPQISKNEFP